MQAIRTVIGAAVAPVFGPPMWTETLFGCNEHAEICCEEFFCSYCHLGFMYEWQERRTLNMDALVCCGTLFCDAVLLAGIARCCVIHHLRMRLRRQYHIDDHQEGSFETCAIAFCCSCCAMCQMHREMNSRMDYTGGIFYKPPAMAPVVAAMAAVPFGLGSHHGNSSQQQQHHHQGDAKFHQPPQYNPNYSQQQSPQYYGQQQQQPQYAQQPQYGQQPQYYNNNQYNGKGQY